MSDDIVIRGGVKKEGSTWTAHVEATWRSNKDTWSKCGFASREAAEAEVRRHCASLAKKLGGTMEDIQ